MSEFEVRALLGVPLAVRPSGSDAYLLDYAIDVPFVHHSPKLWVFLHDGKVDQVQAERSSLWHLDDEGIYVRRSDLRWEASAFASTFD